MNYDRAFVKFIQRMASYSLACQQLRQTDIEATKNHLKAMGYSQDEIAQMRFTSGRQE
jgi:hypothetical protein